MSDSGGWIKDITDFIEKRWRSVVKFLGSRECTKSIAGKTVQAAKEYELEDQLRCARGLLESRKFLMDVTDEDYKRAIQQLTELRDQNSILRTGISTILEALASAKRHNERLQLFIFIFGCLAERAAQPEAYRTYLFGIINDLPDALIDDLSSDDSTRIGKALERVVPKLIPPTAPA